ncbi:pantetheine-phosphate adenylyltransferase [Mycoplasma seminis]|uniref:Pantetheine-phosphate adenylyltransferase n=1 Tax=Mycoplasma seminis TaxID=512749 RepID=A0ABY9HA52_9MOLU|nr:pantetheine-phosphate adenylyltransferase [Mycoplasma seminis]WLP85465.1 pantetheine-phosphate adenylyltransferase [Mycoplasma seminis]
MQNKIALFAGSFNPFHLGHQSIVQKGLKLFDEIYIVVTYNPEKDNLSSMQENYAYIKQLYANEPNIHVDMNQNQLTAQYARDKGIKWLLRSARNDVDFNYELQLACGNKELNNELETVLILPDCSNISYQSRLIRQKEKYNV